LGHLESVREDMIRLDPLYVATYKKRPLGAHGIGGLLFAPRCGLEQLGYL